MKFFFFPSMAFGTTHTIRATCILNTFNIVVLLPKWTLYWLIIILFRVPSIILNIMCVNALPTIMVRYNRTPNSFKRIQMEFQIFLHFIYEFEGYLRLVMSERAEFAIRAKGFERCIVVGITCIFSRNLMLFTVLTFITTRMIQLLNFVVRVWAIHISASSNIKFCALYMIIAFEVGPSVIFLVVIIYAKVFIVSTYI